MLAPFKSTTSKDMQTVCLNYLLYVVIVWAAADYGAWKEHYIYTPQVIKLKPHHAESLIPVRIRVMVPVNL